MNLGKRVMVLIGILIVLSVGLVFIPEEEDFKNRNNPLTGYVIFSDNFEENYDLLIEKEPYNLSESYTGVQQVIIEYNGKERVRFDWDFSNELNLSEIEIKTQSNSENFGYTIVNGVEFNKRIYVDKKIEESEGVCVRSDEVENISEITDSCMESEETPIKCEGISDRCVMAGDMFIVSGVEHSAVKEFYPNETGEDNISLPNTSECSPNWSCEEWSECIDGEQMRVCVDENGCGNQSEKPEEERNCSQECTPDWVCDEWSECNENNKQTRECEDINNCGTGQDKPEEERDCPEEGGNNVDLIANIIFYTLVGLASLIFLLIVTTILKEYFFPYSSFSLIEGSDEI